MPHLPNEQKVVQSKAYDEPVTALLFTSQIFSVIVPECDFTKTARQSPEDQLKAIGGKSLTTQWQRWQQKWLKNLYLDADCCLRIANQKPWLDRIILSGTAWEGWRHGRNFKSRQSEMRERASSKAIISNISVTLQPAVFFSLLTFPTLQFSTTALKIRLVPRCVFSKDAVLT